MPLQHASAGVLKRMKRGANGDIFLKLIERIRRTIPGIAIRTSFIVGFPGETRVPILRSCADLQKPAKFDNLGVFTYSDEDTSESYKLDAKVDGRTIQNRKRRLMAIQRKIARTRNRALGGRRSERAGIGPVSGDRPFVGSTHAHPGSRDRWRYPDQRFLKGNEPSAGRCENYASPKRTTTT